MPATLKTPISRSKQKSKAPRIKARTARLEVRITPADKKLFAQAAEERGMNPSELALLLIRRVARQVREKTRIMKYSQKDQEALIASLLNPQKPNRRLLEANKRYESLFVKV